jgi:hypothetical protein
MKWGSELEFFKIFLSSTLKFALTANFFTTCHHQFAIGLPSVQNSVHHQSTISPPSVHHQFAISDGHWWLTDGGLVMD